MYPLRRFVLLRFALPLLLLFGGCSSLSAYSVLSHEEVVDMAWNPAIVPLLRARFPGLTQDQLREAHSYAYGGCLIQDLGYYPFGNRFFSDLLHYVRTGDFVESLLKHASNADELAFAFGALAHYTADSVGHPYVNRVTSDEYPKLKKKFGKVVTYEQSPTSHVRTEFGFDVVEVAHGRYSQDNYRDFIGFRVSKTLLGDAFRETYGLEMADILHNEDHAINTYRGAVSNLIPSMTKIAATAYAKQIQKENPTFDKRKFVYRLQRTEFEQQWGRDYSRPGFKTRFMAFLIRVVPKVGPLKVLKPKIPTAAEQDEYVRSVNRTVDQYIRYLRQMGAPTADAHLTPASAQSLQLAPNNLDTGDPVRFGQYRLADETHEKLVKHYLEAGAHIAPTDVVVHLAAYYAAPPAGEHPVSQEDVDAIRLKLRQLQERATVTPTSLPN